MAKTLVPAAAAAHSPAAAAARSSPQRQQRLEFATRRVHVRVLGSSVLRGTKKRAFERARQRADRCCLLAFPTMVRAPAGVSCLALLVTALALCACFVSARSERLDAGAGAMDAAALKSCLGSVHSRDAEEKLLALGSAWNNMGPPARLAFLQEIRRAERAEEVDDFTLLQIAAVESPEFSRAPVGCFSSALQVRECGSVTARSASRGFPLRVHVTGGQECRCCVVANVPRLNSLPPVCALAWWAVGRVGRRRTRSACGTRFPRTSAR